MRIISFVISFVLVVVLLFVFFDTYNKTGLYEVNHTENLNSTGNLSEFDATFEERLLIGEVRSIELSHEDEFMAVGINSAQKLLVYTQNLTTGGYDALVPKISTVGLGNVYGVNFSLSTNKLAVGHTTSPYIRIYDRVGETFTTHIDTDLTLDNIVYDLKYYDNDNYLIVGGDFTNFLQVFKYENGDYTKLVGNIDILPTDRVWDIEYSNGYIFIATEATPYFIAYKQVGDNLVKLDNPTNLPTAKAYSIDVNDRGDLIAIGQETTPFIKTYKFENESFTDVTFNIIPTQTLVTWSTHFVDNTYLYTAGDLGVYKYKINNDKTAFINETNDLTDLVVPIYVMDHTKKLNEIYTGDDTGLVHYTAVIDLTFNSLYLREDPEYIISVKQGTLFKDYILNDNELIVSDQDYNIDIKVKYITTGQDRDPLLVIIPILVIVAVVGSVVFYIKD